MTWSRIVACQRVRQRGEHELAQPASELRQVDALARRGQQHLLDHLLDVLGVRRRSRRLLRSAVDAEAGTRSPGAEASLHLQRAVVDRHAESLMTTCWPPLASVIPELSRVTVLPFGSVIVIELAGRRRASARAGVGDDHLHVAPTSGGSSPSRQ